MRFFSVYTAIQGIIDATNDQLKEIEKECAENNEVRLHLTLSAKSCSTPFCLFQEHFDNKAEKIAEPEKKSLKSEDSQPDSLITSDELIKLDDSEDKENKPTHQEVELQKRFSHLKDAMHIKSVENFENSDLKSVFLEGELPHDPQILVSATETETKTERMSNYAKDVADDETVILSGKMTISLISLSNNDEDKNGVAEEHTTTNNVA